MTDEIFLCSCGCGEQIDVKRHHKYRGIPKYIKGHNRRKRWGIPTRECSQCGKITIYSTYRSYARAEEKNSKCSNCSERIYLPLTQEQKLQRSLSRLGYKSSRWKGGKNRINNTIRKLTIYDEWRKKVFERDRYTCQLCGQIGCRLNAHHRTSLSVLIDKLNIKTSEDAVTEEKLWLTELGITVCEDCHKKLHKEHGYKIDVTNK